MGATPQECPAHLKLPSHLTCTFIMYLHIICYCSIDIAIIFFLFWVHRVDKAESRNNPTSFLTYSSVNKSALFHMVIIPGTGFTNFKFSFYFLFYKRSFKLFDIDLCCTQVFELCWYVPSCLQNITVYSCKGRNRWQSAHKADEQSS